MTISYVITLAENAILLTLLVGGPMLILSLVIGVIISLVQAATQVNEVTLTFIPKILGLTVVILFFGSWMLQQLLLFTTRLFESLPTLVH